MFQCAMHGASECAKLVTEVQCVLFYFGARWENKFEFTQMATMHLFYIKNSDNWIVFLIHFNVSAEFSVQARYSSLIVEQ